MTPVGSSSTKLIALVAAIGLGVAGLALWNATHRTPLVDSAVSVPPAAAAPGTPAASSEGSLGATGATGETVGASPAGPIRGNPRDRDMTASSAAFQVYQEGLGLLDRLPIQAAARFRKSVLLDPAFAPGHYRLAMTDVLVSRQDEAKVAIKAAALNQDRLPEPYRTSMPVLTLFIDGAFDLVMASMREALARQPAGADLHYMAGTISARVCDYFDPNSVIEHFEQVLAVEPDYPGVRAALMEAYEMKGMHDWRLSRAQENQAHHPDSTDAIAETGRARIARGEYGDAMEAADEVVRRGEDVFANGLAPVFILTGHHEQLASMYDPEMERTNSALTNVLTHLHAGINDVWAGRFSKALEHFERGPEFLPAPWEKSARARFLLLLGRTHSLLGRTREANAAFEAAETTAGPQPVLEYSLGRNLLKAGSRADAERVVHRLSQESRPSQPGWTEPWRSLMMGEIALASGDAARALDAFREAWQFEEPLALDCIAGHTEAYFLDALGRGYLAAGMPAEALQSYERIRALGVKGLYQPEIEVLSQYYSGRALEAMGKDDEAATRYLQFLKLWGSADNEPAEVADAKSRMRGKSTSR